MLTPLKETEYQAYIDYAYGLALDRTKSSYPTYTDGLKTKEDFIKYAARAFQRDNQELLLFEDGGRVLGWVHYYVIPEDRYIGAQSILTEEKTAQAMEELMARLGEKYPGWTFWAGFSEENRSALAALESMGFQRTEESLVGVLKFADYSPLPEDVECVEIGAGNFDQFAALHAMWDGEMYWDNAHLREALDDWHIYMVEDRAAIYFRYVGKSMEIFGVDFRDGVFDPEALRALLVKGLNRSKADGMVDLTYFHEEEERPVLEEVGIHKIDRYLGYKREV